MGLLDQFERIYIVNLPERSDRRRAMDRELASLGLRADGSRVRYFRAVRPADAGDFPSIGARGCFLSHRGILAEAMQDRLGSVLVLEDDAQCQPALLTARGLDAGLRGDWDFAYLGHQLDAQEGPVRWLTTHAPLATTHAYALSGRVIAPLAAYLDACLQRPVGHPLGSPMHVDGAYSLFRRQHPQFTTLLASSPLVTQRSSRSDIYPNRWFDRTAGARQLVAALRGVKNRLRPATAAGTCLGESVQ
jgi:hypothetical protein